MATIYEFPGEATRYSIDRMIQAYASSEVSRQQMMAHIDGVLTRLNITKIHVRNYVIRVAAPIMTSRGIFPVVTIEAPEGDYKACPVCGHSEYSYLAGEAPVITAWCTCGSIYRKEVRREEVDTCG